MMELRCNMPMEDNQNTTVDGGDSTRWTVPAGQHITKVYLRSGDFIDSIQFITNKNEKSPKIGGNGGKPSIIEIPEGKKIVGIFGG